MNIDFTFYLKLFIRRLPVMALFVIVATSLGVISALKLPETWVSSARLLVEAPRIPANMVRSTVQTNAVEQLDIIQQRMTTRANLIDIANKHNVFESIRSMEPDTVVRQMRSATKIRRIAGQNRATLLTISFEARSGPVAAAVVNEFVTIVLEENTAFRIGSVEGTLDFFEDEAARLAEELDTKGLAITRFKSENIEALPENQGYRLGRQTLLQERLERLEREKTGIEAQREDLIEVFESTGRIQTQGGNTPRTQAEQLLASAQAELTRALTVYSDTHPSVVRLRNSIEVLETQVAADAGIADVAQQESDAESALLTASLVEIDTRLEFLQVDIDQTSTELDRLQTSIAQSAANGIRLNNLEREYKIIEGRYNTALTNLNSATMSERIETAAQGQRVAVIENANVPRVPAGPNRSKVALMGAAVGIGMAGAYFVLLEILNRRIRRPAEMISRFNITPITTIPYMESRRHRMLRRGGIIAATLLVIITVPTGLWYIDTNYLPLEIVVQKGLNRLGLG